MNLVFIVADDMRADQLAYMPLTTSLMTVFPNAFNTNPVCCASRASMLTGKRSQTTRVYGNSAPVGGYEMWRDAGFADTTIGAALFEAGYRCGLMGKYMNGYDPRNVAEVPRGWEEFYGITTGGGAYYGTWFSHDGVAEQLLPGVYLTDWLADRAWDFLMVEDDRPFCLYLAPVSPHKDHVPAPRHATAFADLPPYRPESFDVPGVFPVPALTLERVADIDAARLEMLRCVLSLDELVARVCQAVRLRGAWEDTLIVFCSDNGFMWGEHRLFGKSVPYIEATRMALAMAGGPVGVSANRSALLQHIDWVATAAALAEVDYPCDGVSFLPVLSGEVGRDRIYIEHHAEVRRKAWVQAQQARRTYTLFSDGSEQVFNLLHDPYELRDIHAGADSVGEDRAFVQAELAKAEPPYGWVV